MTAFEEQPRVANPVEFTGDQPREGKRPPRWAVSNWPVAWKVFVVVLVPLLVAAGLGGWRVSWDWTQSRDLRLAVDRAAVVPSVDRYLAALDGAMLANSTGGDVQASLSAVDAASANLRKRAADIGVAADVRTATTALLDGGQALLDQVAANGIDLRGRLSEYLPLLVDAENAVNGSVRSDDSQVRTQMQGLTSALRARGQATTQQLLVNLGADLPEPELRTSLLAQAAAEPSTVPAAASSDVQRLQDEKAKRSAIISDPAAALVANPDLTQSLQATSDTAGKIIESATASVTGAVTSLADAKRNEAIRDSAIVGGAILLALLIVLVVARALVRPLKTLRDGALRVAHEDLVQELERVRSGEEPGPIRLLPVYTTEEVGQVAHAIDELHEQAVLLGGEQAGLQLQIGDMFETLSRRSRSLVDEQLGLIDRLERDEEDPERLQTLFELDHLVARMRRNGANLLVLAGASRPREHAAQVPIGTLVNAAASEVEEYARVVTLEVPDSEVHGTVADDVVHVLAELLDNALRYSPPASDVRVSAGHTGNGGLVIEVADDGLGMTDADLRVANTRLQSGGEVNPYTARHMGLFVVGRLAARHGLVVRLRSTNAGDPNSGTTAGVFIPVELLQHGTSEPSALDHDVLAEYDDGYEGHDERSGHDADVVATTEDYEDHDATAKVPISLLPQRNPGASGISNIPSAPIHPVDPVRGAVDEQDDWPEDVPSARRPAAEPPHWRPPVESSERPVAMDTSSSFAANDAQEPKGGSIFEKMLSEWLIDDPAELAKSSDLDWQTVWDQGWSAAAAAEREPVSERTEQGLPVRTPGARLVPGAAGETGHHGRNGEDEGDDGNGGNGGDESTLDTGPIPILRDPEAVRASIGNHFGGVHAGRSHSRDGGETDRG